MQNRHDADSPADRIEAMLSLIQDGVPLTRRTVHADDSIYRAGDPFECLHVVHAGCLKTVSLAEDGRERVAGLHFKGDWFGFDGLARGAFACDALSLDVGEIWSVPYATLLDASRSKPALLHTLHRAMARAMERDRESLLSLCTLSADARVAEFLRNWAESLAQRGQRSDRITLRLSRAEIGNYLGMTLETVSRALSKLARDHVIGFAERGRRDVCIPNVAALTTFVERSLPTH